MPHVPVNWSIQETYETQSAGRQFLSVLPAGAKRGKLIEVREPPNPVAE